MELEMVVTHPGDVTDVMFAPEQLDVAPPPIIDVTRMERGTHGTFTHARRLACDTCR